MIQVNKCTNLAKQEAEIEAFKKNNPDKWVELPMGYSSVKGYDSLFKRMIESLGTKGVVIKSEMKCNTSTWAHAVMVIKQMYKRDKYVTVSNHVVKGEVVGLKMEKRNV